MFGEITAHMVGRKKLGLTAENFNHSDEKVTYHASCHLCRGLGVKEAPRELIAAAADYVPAAEEEVCCGFGGTYSAKFPEVSAALLRKKLDGIADHVVVHARHVFIMFLPETRRQILAFLDTGRFLH